MPRVHLDAARDERGADRVLRRAGVRAGRDDLAPGLREQQRQVGRLRLEVDDDGDAAAAQRSVREPLAREPVQDGRMPRDPGDPLLALGGERRIGDPGSRGGIHAANLDQILRRGLVVPHLELRRREE